MNRKQLITLVVLGVVIGGLGFLLYQRDTASWKASDQAMGQNILKDFPLNDVTQVRIQAPDGQVNLVKLEDHWTVKERWNYPANFGQVSDLIRKIWELKSVQTQKIGPSQYGRLGLLAPDKDKSTNAATLLEFKDKSGKPISSLLLGKKATRSSDNASPYGGDYPVGRYIALPPKPERVCLVSETFSDAEANPDHWLDKQDFFKVEKLRSISVTHPEATNSWKIAREKEGGDLELVDKQPGEDFDKNKAYSAGNALSYPSFNDVANPEAKPGELGLDKAITATIETFDNFVYHVKVAPAPDTNDTYHLQMTVQAEIVKERQPGKDEKPEDKEKLDKEFKDKVTKLEEKLKKEKACEKWTYLVSKWTVDPLLKVRKDFLADKKAEETKTESTPTTTSATKLSTASSSPKAEGIKAEAKTPKTAAAALDTTGFPPLPPLPEPEPEPQPEEK